MTIAQKAKPAIAITAIAALKTHSRLITAKHYCVAAGDGNGTKGFVAVGAGVDGGELE
jgi:hypothetical protein